MQSSSFLPDHPSASSSYQELSLLTNQYRVTIPESSKVYIYTVFFDPPIASDNSRLKKQVIRSVRPEICKYLERFIHCGENLFSLKDLLQEIQTSPSDDDSNSSALSVDIEAYSSVTIETNFNGSHYKVRIQNSGEQDINTTSLSKNSALQFYNILLRDKLKAMKLVQLGSNRDHFDPSAAMKLPNYPASIWPGYFTSINLLRSGLFLTIDSSFRLVRNDSVFEVIQEITRARGGFSRDAIRRELRNKVVMTFYGSQTMYRIDDVLFDEHPGLTFASGSREVTYETYFKEKYQVKITVKNQPLLLVRRNLKSEPVRLIPELCRMTGAGSLNEDFALKKEVSGFTRLKPDQRMGKIQDLAARLSGTETNYWNMAINNNAVAIKGLQLPHPSILTGTKPIQINSKSSFNLANCEILNKCSIDRWQIFYIERDLARCKELVSSLQNLGNSSGVSLKNPIMHSVEYCKNMDNAFTSALSEKVHEKAQIVMILLPKNLSHVYKSIKALLTTDKPTPSQVVFTSSIDRRDMSIYSKILTQMACKVGSAPWKVTLPAGLPTLTMLVGIDVCHNTFHAGQSVLGFCASLDSNFTKYYSRVAFHDPMQEISTSLTPLFLESLKQFYLNNKKQKPERIIIYRDGVGTSQYNDVVSLEIPQLTSAIREFDRNWKPEIVAVVVNKRVNQRFFCNRSNPGAGVVVDRDIVWAHYNFYLVSHNAAAGTMTPTHYNVVINDSQMTSKCLYELTYNLCYMYFNWQGGIRVPAPCMYAHKIAYLVGKNTGVNFSQKLAPTLFFL